MIWRGTTAAFAGPRKNSSVVLHRVAVQRRLVDAHAEDSGVALVVLDAVIHLGVSGHVALEAAVDDVGGHAVAGHAPGGGVGGGRGPRARHHVMAGGLGRLRRHPKPQPRLVSGDGIGGDAARVVDERRGVAVEVVGEAAVVVVPRQLHRAAALVRLPGCARAVVPRRRAWVASGAVLRTAAAL